MGAVVLTRDEDEVGDVDAAEAIGRATREDPRVVELDVAHAQRPVVGPHPVPVPAEVDRTSVLVPGDQRRRVGAHRTLKAEAVAGRDEVTTHVARRHQVRRTYHRHAYNKKSQCNLGRERRHSPLQENSLPLGTRGLHLITHPSTDPAHHPSSIQIQSAVLPQYAPRRDRPTDRQTDRQADTWDWRQLCTKSRLRLYSVSDAANSIQQ